MTTQVNTVVVGGGQAGLSVSYYLTKHAIDHVVLEQANLPADACVEVPCDLGAAGPRPRAVGALPVQLAALNRTFLNVVELTVHAALTGSRDHVYQAALLDPNTSATLTTDQTVAMCDELLEAHAALLPSFAR